MLQNAMQRQQQRQQQPPMMQTQQMPMQQPPMLQTQQMPQQMPQDPMQQGAVGGKGGMPGAGPAPNAMQQFSQQQGLAGLMQPQQSSLNSLQ
jgi:hypothetical protein